jgi:RNA polymerase sigma-70 factor (ECF subfamily)
MICATCEAFLGTRGERFVQLNPPLEDARQEEERLTVERARTGDAQALSQLYDSYFPRVYRYIHARTGDAAEAEDITEETFLRMLSGIGQFEWRRAPFAAWIFRIARNQVVSYARKNGARRNESPLPESMVDTAPDPLTQVESRLSFEEVLEAAKGLPSAQREVVWMRFAVGLSVSDTARALGKREGNVKVLQHKAIGKLQKLLVAPESGDGNL